MVLSEKNQKIFSIALKVFTVLVVAVTIAVMVFTVITVALFDKNDRAVFGYKFFIVQSDSMSLSDKNADITPLIKKAAVPLKISKNEK